MNLWIKFRQLRERYKNVNIEVDGGVNLETAPNVIKAGANILIVVQLFLKAIILKKQLNN